MTLPSSISIYAPLGESLTDLPTEPSLKLAQKRLSSSLPGMTDGKALRSTGNGVYLSSSTPGLPQTLHKSSAPMSGSPRGARHDSYEASPSTSARSPSPTVFHDHNEEPRQIILKSFAPCIAVYASVDTEKFIKSKGFEEGFKGLLRPFGERIQGKVVIRDSVGASGSWEDFGIRFIDLAKVQYNGLRPLDRSQIGGEAINSQNGSGQQTFAYSHKSTTPIDMVVEHRLRLEDAQPGGKEDEHLQFDDMLRDPPTDISPVYSFYLRKLLSSMPLVPYETFSHPVACIIAVSSHSPDPIENLRQLYASTGRGGIGTPAWVGTEYLRYYILVHDEEKDDIARSTALFDLMKRHFGLHCHLLRLKSSHCVQTDDDCIQIPQCDWLSAEEELVQMQTRDQANGFESPERYILESDATAIKSLLREMVTQSIVPFMEGRVMTWNDQVASRRRGISGRFISLSKRWTGFGIAKGSPSGAGGSPAQSGSNYDTLQGFYPPETPEATMRQLADYAFMLRDWKLAYNTYDLLRTDFANDKAWKYNAAANEMAAISSLLVPQTTGSSSRSETVDHMLDTASYSYLTRCSMPSGVVRCLTIAIELLQSRGSAAAVDAARWGGKLLELGVSTPLAQAFLTERIADCYRPRTAAPGPLGTTSRTRQIAFWNLLSSETWTRLGISVRAQRRLREASVHYRGASVHNPDLPFQSMQTFWGNLEHKVQQQMIQRPGQNYQVGLEAFLTRSEYDLANLERSNQPISSNDLKILTTGMGRLNARGSNDATTSFTDALVEFPQETQIENDGFE